MKKLVFLIAIIVSQTLMAQNVGIGISNPIATIDVARGTGVNGTAAFRGSTHISHFNFGTDEDTYIRAGKNNRYVILNDIAGGLVGIGTSTPLQKLHVEGATFLNGNVGIGANTPFSPLTFNNILGEKISFYGSATNNYGLGIQGFTLQIHSATVGDDIAFGYGSSFSFTETMRIKGTGALVFAGNAGTTGQVLLSNGPAGVSQWGYANSHYIGESYGGGIVFYVYDNGRHGLIAATADQSSGIEWRNGTYRYTGTTGDGLNAGAMNTSLIIATQMADNQTGNFAAKVCADYSVTIGGITYGDWYLPSKHELNLLYLQKTVVGGFSSNYYWSSSEFDNFQAWDQGFGNGNQFNDSKFNTWHVRAVRAF